MAKRPRAYGNMMATVAVFIALGGLAWAVAANSIGSKKLKRKAVRRLHMSAGRGAARH